MLDATPVVPSDPKFPFTFAKAPWHAPLELGVAAEAGLAASATAGSDITEPIEIARSTVLILFMILPDIVQYEPESLVRGDGFTFECPSHICTAGFKRLNRTIPTASDLNHNTASSLAI